MSPVVSVLWHSDDTNWKNCRNYHTSAWQNIYFIQLYLFIVHHRCSECHIALHKWRDVFFSCCAFAKALPWTSLHLDGKCDPQFWSTTLMRYVCYVRVNCYFRKEEEKKKNVILRILIEKSFAWPECDEKHVHFSLALPLVSFFFLFSSRSYR